MEKKRKPTKTPRKEPTTEQQVDELRLVVADVVRTLTAAIQRLAAETATLNTLISAIVEHNRNFANYLSNWTAENADEVKRLHDERIQAPLEIEQNLRRVANRRLAA